MRPGQRKPVLYTHKTWPNFEGLKYSKFLSVMSIVTIISLYMQKSMRSLKN